MTQTILTVHQYPWEIRVFGQRKRIQAMTDQIMNDFGLYVAPTWLALKRSDEVQAGLWYLAHYDDHDTHTFAGLEMQLKASILTIRQFAN